MLSSPSFDIAHGNEDDIFNPDDSSTKKDMLVGKENFDLNKKNDGLHFADTFALTEQVVKKYFIDGGPCVIFGHYLTVQPWTIDFNPNLPYPNSVLTWIRFPSLPSHSYKKQFLMEIGGRSLIFKILINGNPQRIEYENLPVVCFKCGYYCHTKEACSSVTQIQGGTEKGESSGQVSNKTAAVGKEVFSHWMLVERKSRSGNLEASKKGNNLKGDRNLGSRFHSLADLEAIHSVEETIKESLIALKEKDKGKAPLIGSISGLPRRKKSFINGSKNSIWSFSMEKFHKGQARVVQSNNPLASQPTEVKEGVLEAKNHSTVVFSNKILLENVTEVSGGILAGINLSNEIFKGQNSKKTGSEGARAKLIASEIDRKSVIDSSRQLEEDVERSSFVHQ
ncbi:hypothetical protein GOBAR_AA01847 [Gossypium barbadense]|uniref:Uncharacterized protein n=1 Tax=Gossypium barbadense TaxID=3634 RepID=A0A2P5YSZ0_GOSBA|nr:hypothetical protein GOBAR_AA01847 [Gossypium barbadense]